MEDFANLSWFYVPHGSALPIQMVAPLLGGIADGESYHIGFVEELPDCLERFGENCVHYYALEQRGKLWVYTFVLSEVRAKR
jgi:hypothetical protein